MKKVTIKKVYVHNHFTPAHEVGALYINASGNKEFSYSKKPSPLNHDEIETSTIEEEISKFPQSKEFLLERIEELEKNGGEPIIYG